MEWAIVSGRRRTSDTETTPLGDELRLLGVQYTADGNPERGKGYVHSGDIVDGKLHLLTGRAFVEALDRMLDARLEAFVADVVAAIRDSGPAVGSSQESGPPPPAPTRSRRRRSEPLDALERARPAARPPPAPLDLPSAGLRKVLVAVAQHMPEGVDRVQLSILTGYKRSTRDLYVQRAARAGWIGFARGRLVATAKGLGELGPGFVPLPTGHALLAHWLHKLPEGERRVLTFIAGFYPHPVSRDRISDEIRYQRSTRDLYLQRLARRHLIETTGAGHVAAAAHLFDGPKVGRAAGT